MRAFLSFLIMPLPVFWLLLFFTIFLFYLKKEKLKIVFLCISVFWLFFISTSVLSRYPVLFLEKQNKPLIYVPDSIKSKSVHILVLGSGHTFDTAFTAIDQLSLNAVGRLAEGIRLHKQIPASKLILSGWGADQPKSQAEVLRDAALELGIEDSCLFIQPKPWNTKDEAVEYKKLFDANIPLILVTDAIHMPRSYYHFRNAGLIPIPAPTNHMIKEPVNKKFMKRLLFSSQNIWALEKAFHEYMGLLWAHLGGN